MPDWVDSRLNIANEMNNELEDIEQKLPKNETQRHKKELKENEKSISELWDLASKATYLT